MRSRYALRISAWYATCSEGPRASDAAAARWRVRQHGTPRRAAGSGAAAGAADDGGSGVSSDGEGDDDGGEEEGAATSRDQLLATQGLFPFDDDNGREEEGPTSRDRLLTEDEAMLSASGKRIAMAVLLSRERRLGKTGRGDRAGFFGAV